MIRTGFFAVLAALFFPLTAVLFADGGDVKEVELTLSSGEKAEGTEESSKLGAGTTAGEQKTIDLNGIDCTFIWCPAGTFMMGSSGSEEGQGNDETLHSVTISRGYWLLETPVTLKMWRHFMKENSFRARTTETGNEPEGVDTETGGLIHNSRFDSENPGFEQAEDQPVTEIDWFAAAAFCKWFSEKTGCEASLPTEAEWEYACRAGSNTPWYFGEDVDLASRYANLDSIDNGFPFTAPVKSFTPNSWGLYDMHGNVSEWCQDWYGPYTEAAETDPAGPDSGTTRSARGGSWHDSPAGCRSAARTAAEPSFRSALRGFRILVR